MGSGEKRARKVVYLFGQQGVCWKIYFEKGGYVGMRKVSGPVIDSYFKSALNASYYDHCH